MGLRRHLSVWLIIGICTGLSLISPVAASQSGDNILYHTVEPDETLGMVALKYKVGIEELQSWNELSSIDVEQGMTLIVQSSKPVKRSTNPLPVVHIVKSGDTFESIARQYRVAIRQVQQWNRRINPRRMQIGAQVRLYIPGRDGKSVSWGSANRGRLYNGVAMQSSPGLRVRNVARAYGTKRTIDLLAAAGADVRARWPDAPDLVVGSLSVRNGGPLRPHRSHQSGRDADVNYYHRGNYELPDFRDMSVESFDAAKNWHIFKILIDSGEVEYIFVDYRLQKPLYDYARSIGYTEEELEPILQYPRRGAALGIIRHSRGHLNHWHIRFKCGPDDRNCV